MNLKTILYAKYEDNLPQEGNYILGQLSGDNIIVYQAFNKGIAAYAAAHQKFGGPAYSFSRMTWIKPNFLWMMYRCGWASKENQEHVLAIEISFAGFENLLEMGVHSSYQPAYGNEAAWKQSLAESDVRIQWDPDHNPHGASLKRRAVQIGLRGKALEQFNSSYIQRITDITEFVKEQKSLLEARDKNFSVIAEEVINVNARIKEKFRMEGTGRD